MTLASTLEELKAVGWHVDYLPQRVALPEHIVARYPAIPVELRDLLEHLSRCSNADETAWVLGAPELDGSSDSAFAWNEFELMSLSAVAGDAGEEAEVRAFWGAYFPFLLSVKAGYSFFAVALAGTDQGKVVHGLEPLFEEATVVAASLSSFFSDLVRVARGDVNESILAAAV